MSGREVWESILATILVNRFARIWFGSRKIICAIHYLNGGDSIDPCFYPCFYPCMSSYTYLIVNKLTQTSITQQFIISYSISMIKSLIDRYSQLLYYVRPNSFKIYSLYHSPWILVAAWKQIKNSMTKTKSTQIDGVSILKFHIYIFVQLKKKSISHRSFWFFFCFGGYFQLNLLYFSQGLIRKRQRKREIAPYWWLI